MGLAPVDDVGLPHSPAHRPQAGLHLGDHAGVELGDEGLEGVDADARDERAPVGPVGVEPLDVGEHNELLRVQGDGDGGRGGVGVDVEDRGRVGEERGDGGDDGDAPLLQQLGHRAGVDLDDVAHEPDVDALAVDRGQALARPQQAAVLPGDAHGGRARLIEQGDELALDRPGQDHADHVHDLGRGHAQAAAELRLDAQALEHGVDLGAAAVDDDGAQAHLVEEEDVGGEGPLEGVVDHGVAAVLDDDGRPLVGAQPGHGLQQDGGLLRGGQVGGDGDVCVIGGVHGAHVV